MSLSIGWRDVGDSAFNTVKMMGLALATGVVGELAGRAITRTFDYLNLPYNDIQGLPAAEAAQRNRNSTIMLVSTAALMAVVPALLPIQFKPFTVHQTIQLVALDTLIYLGARVALPENTFMNPKDVGVCLLGGTLLGTATVEVGNGSNLILPAVFAAKFLTEQLNP